MQTVDTSEEIRPKRPVFLLVLCILSFIWLGFGVTQGLLAASMGPDSKEQIAFAQKELDKQIEDLEAQGMTDWTPTFEKLKHMVIVMNDNFYAVQLLAFLIYGIGITAVVMMFRGRKLGFHLYVMYTLLSICDYYFFISPSMIPTMLIVFSALLGALFVGLYTINLKWMR